MARISEELNKILADADFNLDIGSSNFIRAADYVGATSTKFDGHKLTRLVTTDCLEPPLQEQIKVGDRCLVSVQMSVKHWGKTYYARYFIVAGTVKTIKKRIFVVDVDGVGDVRFDAAGWFDNPPNKPNPMGLSFSFAYKHPDCDVNPNSIADVLTYQKACDVIEHARYDERFDDDLVLHMTDIMHAANYIKEQYAVMEKYKGFLKDERKKY